MLFIHYAAKAVVAFIMSLLVGLGITETTTFADALTIILTSAGIALTVYITPNKVQ
jgi:hypothetical protein